MKNVTIVGGGASGMTAAIAAARILKNKARVNIIERNDRIGKKLLSTGNGRCNLSNENISAANYQNDCNDFAMDSINSFNVVSTLNFFAGMGLLCKTSSGGRIFPYHENASAVLDVLRNEINFLKINIISNTFVTKITEDKKGFKLLADGLDNKTAFICDKLIISTGGNAAPKTGSDGNGFNLLASLGHQVSSVTPALTQIKTDNDFTKSLKGIKINVRLTAMTKGVFLEQSFGDVIFTDYGLSGTAAFEISGMVLANTNVVIKMDFLPEYKKPEIVKMLLERKERLGHLPLEEFLTGLFNKRVGQALCKRAGLTDMSQLSLKISEDSILRLADIIKSLEFVVKGHTGWDFAQTGRGGVKGEEFDSKTMESKIKTGLYVTGELYEFTGECGGYNLQWAWTSGVLAGEAAARSILNNHE